MIDPKQPIGSMEDLSSAFTNAGGISSSPDSFALIPAKSPVDIAMAFADSEDGPDEIAQKLNQFMDDVAPGMTPQEKAHAQVLAGESLSGASTTPGVEKTKAEASAPAVQANPEAFIEAKREAGENITETMGGLLSLIIPVLAGAAIGGKRGALYSAVGAGAQRLKDIESKKEEERGISKEERVFKRQKELENIQTENAIKVEAAKAGQKPSLEDKIAERSALNRVDANFDSLKKAQDEYDTTAGFLANGKQILSEFGEATKGESWASFQISKRFSSSDLGKLQSRVQGLVFDIVKAKQGSRPSDFDVKTLMKIVTGDFTASPKDAYTLLKNALEDSERYATARLAAAEARTKGQELDAGNRKILNEANSNTLLQQEAQSFGEKNMAKLISLRKQNVPLETVKKGLELQGVVVSDNLLNAIWGE